MRSIRTLTTVATVRARKMLSLSSNEKNTIIRLFWPNLIASYDERQYNDFINLFVQELLAWNKSKANAVEKFLIIASPLIEVVRNSVDLKKTSLMNLLEEKLPDIEEDELINLLDLVTRVWFTINVRSKNTEQSFIRSNTLIVQWDAHSSLHEFMRSALPATAVAKDHSNIKLSTQMTAADLIRRSGIHIAWTNYLNEHLVLDKGRRVLTLYQHKIALVNHLRSSNVTMLESQLWEETIDTLNLLFPFPDAATKKLLQKEHKEFYGLAMCGRSHALDLSAYPHWGSRLLELLEMFSEPPRDFKRLISDRRDLEKLSTLWIGLLVLVLTLVSIAFGTVQTVYAIKQYELALALACATDQADVLLPNFC